METKTPAAAEDVYLDQDFGTVRALKKSWKPGEEEEDETHTEETRGCAGFTTRMLELKSSYVRSR